DHRQALAHATSTLDLARSLDDPVWESDALNAVGWYHAQLGQHQQAVGYCRQALALSRQHGYRECEAATLDSLGYIADSTGDHTAALDHYGQVLTMRLSQVPFCRWAGVDNRNVGAQPEASSGDQLLAARTTVVDGAGH